MTYTTVQHITPVHFTHTFPSIHPRYDWVGFHLFRNCEGKSLPWMFEGPHSGHGGTQMPRNWGARGPKLRSLWVSRLATVHWNHRKTIQLNIGMCFEEYKRGFGVPTLIAVHPENDPKACKLNWNDGCKDSVLGRLFWIRQKDMKLDVSPPKNDDTLEYGQMFHLFCFL